MGYLVHHGSSATLFGHEIFGDDCPRWVEELYWLLCRVDDAIYWLAYRTWDKYHIVKTDMKPGYSDIDEIMFRACFALLRRFVEEELGTKNWYQDHPDCMYKGYRLHFEGDENKEAIDLWLWYKEELPKLEKALEDRSRRDREESGITWTENEDGLFKVNITESARDRVKEYGRLENEISEAKQRKLEQLIRLRRHLWT